MEPEKVHFFRDMTKLCSPSAFYHGIEIAIASSQQ
jgi:hypothetical protein